MKDVNVPYLHPMPKYDTIGIGYSTQRQPDPRLAKQIASKLEGASRILNIGAGTGSYEPEGIDLVAVEPAKTMIDQRRPDAHPVVQASAEQLPIEDKSFSHTMTVLSMHHWTDRPAAFAEIRRVTTDKFIAVTWNPDAGPFWLTRDYFPEMVVMDNLIMPRIDELAEHFNIIEVEPMLIPEDCVDGFLAAYWKRPSAYLNARVRSSISTFGKLKNVEKGLNQLEQDLINGNWSEKNQDILDQPALDAGYVIVSGSIR